MPLPIGYAPHGMNDSSWKLDCHLDSVEKSDLSNNNVLKSPAVEMMQGGAG